MYAYRRGPAGWNLTGTIAPADGDAAARGVFEFGLVSDPYRPADDGGTDTRELGVVLLGVAFQPAAPSEGWWNAPAD